jgi:hypothetical protein
MFRHPTTRISFGFTIIRLGLLPLLLTCIVVSRINAAENDDAKTLTLIADTADRICGIVSLSGEAKSEAVNRKVDAQLNGLASKLVGVGVSGVGNITSDSYKNVLREQLAADLQNLRACRQHVYDSLVIRLLPASSPASQAVPSGNQTTELAERPRALVTGHLGLQFKQNDNIVPMEEEGEDVTLLRLRRAQFEILLPRNLTPEVDRGEEFGLAITVSEDKRLLDLVEVETDWGEPAQRRKAALEKVLGYELDDDEVEPPLFLPGMPMADSSYGSGQLFAVEIPHKRYSGKGYRYTLAFNYIAGTAFNLEKDGQKGVYVSAIMPADPRKTSSEQGGINLMLHARDIYMCATTASLTRTSHRPSRWRSKAFISSFWTNLGSLHASEGSPKTAALRRRAHHAGATQHSHAMHLARYPKAEF